MKKDLQKVLTKLQAKFGDDVVMKLEDVPVSGVISSGSLSLDYATGIGGLPDNRVIEIAGANGAGKSTLSFTIVNNALKKNPDKMALYLDVEGRISTDWVKEHVEDTSRFIVVQPVTAEEATDYYVDALRTDSFCVAVFDSIGGAPTQRVTEKSATSGNVGGNALAITRFSQFAQALSNKHRCLTISLNQIREDLSGYNRLITPGGQAFKHATSLRIELKKKNRDTLWVEEPKGNVIQAGYKVSAKIHKNSIGRSGTAIEYWFYTTKTEKYGPVGIDQSQELINLSVLTGILDKRPGGMYWHEALPNGRIRGYDNMLKHVMSDKEAFEAIKLDLTAKLNEGDVDGVYENFEARDESFDVEGAESALESMIKIPEVEN